MAKTKPIGVRFDEEMLEDLKLTPQKALNLLTTAYYYDTKKMKLLIPKEVEIRNVFIDVNGKETSLAAGKPVKVTITEKDKIDYMHDNSEIENQITAVRSEAKPAFIDKSKFEKYQQKKIAELQKQLK